LNAESTAGGVADADWTLNDVDRCLLGACRNGNVPDSVIRSLIASSRRPAPVKIITPYLSTTVEKKEAQRYDAI
jgi:hypothetical protein